MGSAMMWKTQPNDISKIEQFDSYGDLSAFQSMYIRLNCLPHARTELLFDIYRLAQITENNFINTTATFISQIKKATRYTKRHQIDISFPKLNIKLIRVVVYSDTSLCNNLYTSWLQGYIIFLTESIPTSHLSISNHTIPSTYLYVQCQTNLSLLLFWPLRQK